ncbi:MAG: hypothetical protein ETSY2_14360 [Candidatus Entotheonella gemina]|uniref:Uncharacterized protein n=1 Tax=Candidatus Entotheonella gemina TaxID=1429439 RepID=W4M9L9_9BACT|nr:MAG: hypothetical protein ETSY2_14360 [Candidatus Entotheonella gemina]
MRATRKQDGHLEEGDTDYGLHELLGFYYAVEH